MNRLIGQIRKERLFATINLVPSANSGGPLQAKTVYPSHSEQVIAPDEDYYGLAVVTVKPVPRVPACEVSVKEGEDAVVENVVNIAVWTEVTAQKLYTHFSYNGYIAPKIPDSLLQSYPYCIIRRNTKNNWYDLILSPVKYYLVESGKLSGDGITQPLYTVNFSVAETSTEWVYNKDYTSTIADSDDKKLIWSNHDIPNGSVDSTEIYFAGSEPIGVE